MPLPLFPGEGVLEVVAALEEGEMAAVSEVFDHHMLPAEPSQEGVPVWRWRMASLAGKGSMSAYHWSKQVLSGAGLLASGFSSATARAWHSAGSADLSPFLGRATCPRVRPSR